MQLYGKVTFLQKSEIHVATLQIIRKTIVAAYQNHQQHWFLNSLYSITKMKKITFV